MQPLVSVIIPTYNSERLVEFCLRSILNQTYQNIEIIIVDANSTDNTTSILNNYDIKIINSRKRSRTYQRNHGSNIAIGEFLFFVDSDEIVHNKLIENCVDLIMPFNSDALFIPFIDTGFTYFGKAKSLGSFINLKYRTEVKLPNSTIRFCKKNIYEEINGQDEDLLIGEDVIFDIKCLKKGYKINRSKYPIYHYGVENLKSIFLKKYYYGKTRKRYINRAKLYGVSIRRVNIDATFFYLKNLFKIKYYSGKYILGFLIVKFLERLALLITYNHDAL